jgi:hypothetical protein
MCDHVTAWECSVSDTLTELKGQAGYDAAVEFDSNLCDKPFDLLFETIQCHDKTSGRIMEYTVIDCGTSVLSSKYFVLQDDKGQKEQVTVQELAKMRI